MHLCIDINKVADHPHWLVQFLVLNETHLSTIQTDAQAAVWLSCTDEDKGRACYFES